MDFSLLTYNTLFSNALLGLKKVHASQHPDIICLQEIDTSETTFKQVEALGYKLADYANAFIKFGKIYGVATFYNPKKFVFIRSKVIFLPKGFLEIVMYLMRVFRTGRKNRTILKTEFACNKTGHKLVIYNVHLTPNGTNSLRQRQIQLMLDDVKLTKVNKPTIMTGDFNYPYRRKQLESLMHAYGLKEATNSIFFTMHANAPFSTWLERFASKIFTRFMRNRVKLDYVFYKNCISLLAKKINVEYSDHYPIYTVFKLEKTPDY